MSNFRQMLYFVKCMREFGVGEVDRREYVRKVYWCFNWLFGMPRKLEEELRLIKDSEIHGRNAK